MKQNFENMRLPTDNPENKEEDSVEHNISRRAALEKILKYGVGAASVIVGAKNISELLPGDSEEDSNKTDKKFKPVEQEQSDQDVSKEKSDDKKADCGEKEKVQEKRKVEANENMSPEEIAEEILRVLEKENKVKSKFPPEIFTSNFFIAQQFQESRYKKESASSAGAKGVYQNRKKSIKDVVEYLSVLREKEEVDFRGPEKIDLEMALRIKNLLTKKGDWGRAIGKLYLLSVYDPKYKYNQTPNKNVFAGKSPQEVQKLLLISYHDGPKKRHNPKRCSRNAKNYYRSIFNFMEEIKKIREGLAEFNFRGEEDYAVMLILRKLDNYRGRDARNRVIKKYVELIESHRTENNKFSHNDLEEIFS